VGLDRFMKGIILAAGRGSRMGSLTKNLPKCRTLFLGKELIHRQLDALENPEIDQIAIVRGYLADTFDMDVKYFENYEWETTNMVSSLLVARSWLESNECVVSYSDIVYSANIVSKLVATKGDIVITYDPNWLNLWSLRFKDPLIDAETFRLDGDRVIEIGNRANSISEIQGQFMGLLKFSAKGWGLISDYLEKYDDDSIARMDMTKLLQGLIKQGNEIIAAGIDEPWYEVDTESDLEIYAKSLKNSSSG
jgi:L-glutamine-phosphate cytidylyltransferase